MASAVDRHVTESFCPKVSNKKQRDQAAQDAALKASLAKEKAKGGSDKENEGGAADILGENEDDDIIF